MTTQLWVPRLAVLPTPGAISAYLRAHGWLYVRIESNWAIFTSGEGAAQVTLEVPQLVQAKDYGRALLGVLEELARIEERPESDVLRDIRSSTIDIVRISLEGSAMNDGRISVDAGTNAYEGARNLLMAAACSAVERRSAFANRKPELAMQLMEQARFGQTEVGSFVLTIESTIAPLLQPSLFENPAESERERDDSDEPFERKASILLARGLAGLKQATQSSEASGSFAPFKERVTEGVSANLCDAVAEVLERTKADQFKAGFSFASNRPLKSPVPSSTTFTSHEVPLLREAAKRLRDDADFPDYVIVGTIVSLKSDDPIVGGTIVVRADVEGTLRRVTLKLQATDYQRAGVAHNQIELISCVGDLVKNARSFVLENARGFSVISEPDQSSPP